MTRQTITLDGIEFEAWPEQGAWYEVGRVDEVGALYAPMNADGSLPTSDEIGEIEVTYREEMDELVSSERGHAASRLADCIAHGDHFIKPDENNWCGGSDEHESRCDTGECSSCHRPVFFGADDWYHHITDPERGCFLIGGEDA